MGKVARVWQTSSRCFRQLFVSQSLLLFFCSFFFFFTHSESIAFLWSFCEKSWTSRERSPKMWKFSNKNEKSEDYSKADLKQRVLFLITFSSRFIRALTERAGWLKRISRTTRDLFRGEVPTWLFLEFAGIIFSIIWEKQHNFPHFLKRRTASIIRIFWYIVACVAGVWKGRERDVCERNARGARGGKEGGI